jgi:hypothetical protein
LLPRNDTGDGRLCADRGPSARPWTSKSQTESRCRCASIYSRPCAIALRRSTIGSWYSFPLQTSQQWRLPLATGPARPARRDETIRRDAPSAVAAMRRSRRRSWSCVEKHSARSQVASSRYTVGCRLPVICGRSREHSGVVPAVWGHFAHLWQLSTLLYFWNPPMHLIPAASVPADHIFFHLASYICDWPLVVETSHFRLVLRPARRPVIYCSAAK